MKNKVCVYDKINALFFSLKQCIVHL